MDFLMRLSRQLSFKSPSTANKTVTESGHGLGKEHTTAGVDKTQTADLLDSTPKRVHKLFTLKEVAAHCHLESCWMVICDRVYDFTEFIEFHPGGYEIMLEYGGTDATNAFNEKPHTIDAIDMLEKYLIGELVEADRMFQT